jgi:LmbE family N-acetylglucosaminyl deacetylase
MKKAAVSLLVFLLSLSAARPQTISAPAPGYALEPPSSGGLVALDRLLQRLSVHKRLLVVAAHPDDEDSRLLTLASRRMGAEVAYLSLTRGEGGQNLLGTELGVPLGLIRTQELLAARRIDGGRQYFTRAYDFGYTRSLEETLRLWPKEILEEDALRIVARFRPQIVNVVFTGTPRDGHGQHQASGVIGRALYSLDSSAYPALVRETLPPWKIQAVWRSTYFDPDAASLVLPTGVVDPLTGRSYHQIAMASRSNHRSQDMGALQPPGPNETRVAWVEGAGGPGAKDLFDGIDTRLTAIAAGVPDAARRARIEERLRKAEALVTDTRAKLAPATLLAAAAPIANALTELSAARKLLPIPAVGAEANAAAFLDEKIALAETALATAAEVTIDAVADRETAGPGDPLEVRIGVWNAGSQPVTVESVLLESPDGWTLIPLPPGEGKGEPGITPRPVAPNALGEWIRKASSPAAPTIPYFLRRPMQGALYDWSETAPTVRGEPFQPPALSAVVRLSIGGSALTLSREVIYRFRDQAFGEIRRPVRAVPAVEVAVDPDRIVWPAAHRGVKRLEVTLTGNSSKPLAGRLEIEPPAGWPAVASVPFTLESRGDRRFLDVTLKPPQPFTAGRGTFRVAAVLDDGSRFASNVRVLDYPHVPATPMPEESAVEVVAADIRLPPVKRVGYVRGASDRVPEALAAIGVPLEVLTPKELQSGDLSRYDAIVIGSRAYETEPALARANGRILDYARAGGLVVVQYQQYQFVEGKFAPYPIEIARPHGRVTDENAPVRILDPASPVFRAPNPIGESDWAGWAQERGLYFPAKWDPAYKPLLAIMDPGQPEQQGALLVAKLGKGTYVYTGLAFFRQLPAGVPGAYRLFANLLGLKSKP